MSLYSIWDSCYPGPCASSNRSSLTKPRSPLAPMIASGLSRAKRAAVKGNSTHRVMAGMTPMCGLTSNAHGAGEPARGGSRRNP